jgi:hypothetical protein
MSKEITFLRQLQELKAMTVRTGAVHEAQALQIRNYPKLIPGVSDAKTTVDVENKIVYYDCITASTFRCTKSVKTMCQNINTWVKTILWDETAVVITSGDRALFDSRSQ